MYKTLYAIKYFNFFVEKTAAITTPTIRDYVHDDSDDETKSFVLLTMILAQMNQLIMKPMNRIMMIIVQQQSATMKMIAILIVAVKMMTIKQFHNHKIAKYVKIMENMNLNICYQIWKNKRKKTNSLLKKNRRLIKLINKSSNLTLFIRNEIQRKQFTLDASIDSTDEKKIKINDLVNDFYVRWNSTYIMLIRLLAIQPIINNITFSPNTNMGLSMIQVKKLRSLSNSDLEWELLRSVASVLAPFHLATKCFSGCKYAILSLSYWTTENLYIYVTSETSVSSFENGFKKNYC